MLVGSRSEITFTVSGARGQREMARKVYDPFLDALDERKPRRVGELEVELRAAGLPLGTIFEIILVMAAKGDLVLVQDDEVQERAKSHTDRLNRQMLDRARGAGDVGYLASPVTGGGVGVPRFDQLFLLARRQSGNTADAMARLVWDLLISQGHRVVKEGKTLDTPEENLAELTEQARAFIEQRLPTLISLKID
jgi:hypothetical protein